MKIIKGAFAVFLAITLALCPLMMQAGAEEAKPMQLKFNGGKFKILVLSDIQDTHEPQKETTDFLNAAIDNANPDFIALTGDNIAGWWKGVNREESEKAVDLVAKTINDRKIPFALVFGNHDHEGLCDEKNGMEEEEAKELILSWFNKYEYCLATEGEELTGVGNYNLTVKDSAGEKDIFNMWFMDSNPYSDEEEGGGYGYVHKDQIEWYEKTSNELKAANGGKPLPSVLFQHIVVPEVYEMFTEVPMGTRGAVRANGSHPGKYYIANPDYIYQGNLNEGPCPADKANDGQFESWVKQGDILGAFFGHDHVNDFAGEYKGIKLVAVPAVTFYSYGNHRGVRTITLDENDLSDLKTDIVLFEDLLKYESHNLYKKNHGYIEYKNNFLPIFRGSVAGAAVLTAAAVTVAKVIKKKKNK